MKKDNSLKSGGNPPVKDNPQTKGDNRHEEPANER